MDARGTARQMMNEAFARQAFAAAEGKCSGSGAYWRGGTGSPMCPVCHQGWRALGLKASPKLSSAPVRYLGRVPSHERRSK